MSVNKFDLEKLWDEHLACEFSDRDADETVATMVDTPYVNHIPTMTGGRGKTELRDFYRDHFIAKLPADTKTVTISRTVGENRLVEELVFCFTHDREIDFLLSENRADGQICRGSDSGHSRFRRRQDRLRAYLLGPGLRSCPDRLAGSRGIACLWCGVGSQGAGQEPAISGAVNNSLMIGHSCLARLLSGVSLSPYSARSRRQMARNLENTMSEFVDVRKHHHHHHVFLRSGLIGLL